MARYILVAIDDNALADEYVKSLQEHDAMVTVARVEEGGRDYSVVQMRIEVLGVYARPKTFCEHTSEERKGRTLQGGGFGWRVCPLDGCHKAVKQARHQPKNLLPRADGKPFKFENERYWLNAHEGGGFPDAK